MFVIFIFSYGHALLPGEGAAMAAYVSEGKRIPRRGKFCINRIKCESVAQKRNQDFAMGGD